MTALQVGIVVVVKAELTPTIDNDGTWRHTIESHRHRLSFSLVLCNLLQYYPTNTSRFHDTRAELYYSEALRYHLGLKPYYYFIDLCTYLYSWWLLHLSRAYFVHVFALYINRSFPRPSVRLPPRLTVAAWSKTNLPPLHFINVRLPTKYMRTPPACDDLLSRV